MKGVKITHEEYVAKVELANPNVEVLEKYRGIRTKILHRYKQCGHERKVSPHIILQGCGCYQCMINNRMHTAEEVMHSQKFINSDWEIDGEYNGYKNQVWLKCKKCGYRKFVIPNNKNLNAKCPKCKGNKVIKYGINDLSTLRPDVASMMCDQELAKIIGCSSHIFTNFICQTCGEIIEAEVSNVTKNGLKCKNCSNVYSYPNKFMYKILKNLNINFTPEFSPKWALGRRYDFMFEHHQNKYIIEMDGSFHFINNVLSGKSADESTKIDHMKDLYAKNNGYEMIRIDCNYQRSDRYSYIKENVLCSKLSFLFDLSVVDWQKCDKYAQKSDFSRICYLYDNVTHDVHEISNMLGVCYETTIKHLKHSQDLGCSTYIHDDAVIERNEFRKVKTAIANGNILLCIETNEIFYSIASVKRIYGGCIDKYLKGESEYAGTLIDGTKLHWEVLTNDRANELLGTNQYVQINVDFKLENNIKETRKYRHVVQCNETKEYFISKVVANKRYNACLGHYFMDGYKYSGKLSDGTLLTWRIPPLEEVILYVNNGGVIIS